MQPAAMKKPSCRDHSPDSRQSMQPGPMKKPASIQPLPAPACVASPLTRCKCGGSLSAHRTVHAKCVDLIGISDILHVIKACCGRGCRAHHGYNYQKVGPEKVNTVSIADLKDEVLFINPELCFTLRYLQFSENLLFFGPMSSRGIAQAYKHTFDDATIPGYLRKAHTVAVMYFLAMRELEKVGAHLQIVIGNEVSAPSLGMYDNYVHQHVLPPTDPTMVTELVGDGHQKVVVKCEGTTKKKKAGKPKTGYSAMKSKQKTNNKKKKGRFARNLSPWSPHWFHPPQRLQHAHNQPPLMMTWMETMI